MTPSAYQLVIYNFIKNPMNRHLLVNALAGSGKTTTAKGIVNLLSVEDQHSCVMIAFNKSIAEKLSQELPPGVTASTVHALGYKAIRRHFNKRGEWKPNEYKYREIVKYYWASELSVGQFDEGAQDVMEAMTALVRFVMVTLTDPKDRAAVMEMAAHFGLEIEDWDKALKALPVILKWGIEGLPKPDVNGQTWSAKEVISFDDMIWLPVAMHMRVKQFKWIIVDEAQDISPCQLAFILKMLAPDGHLVFVGDRNQAIYGFTGADAQSFDAIKVATGATELPLSVCYRCPTAVIDLAKEIVPQIEAAPGAKTGTVLTINRNQIVDMLAVGDLVVCRTTAPLIKLVFELIAAGKPGRVRGRDIGKTLAKVLTGVEKLPGYNWAEFGKYLDTYEHAQKLILSQKQNSEMQIQSVEDRCACIRTIHLAEAGTATCADDLKAVIERLFSDETEGIILSTIHRAKGLEYPHVFLLAPEQLPILWPSSSGNSYKSAI